MNRWEKLNELWCEYFSLTVYKNEHLLKPLLHSWLGVYLTKHHKVLHSGEYKTFRSHTFMLQVSGSGKSQAMKTTHHLLNYLKFDSFYTTSTNASSLMGYITKDKMGKEFKKYGLLKRKDAIFWDEGSTLLKPSAHNEMTSEIIQMATDDPGYIARGMREGEFKFKTETTIIAGSYIEESVEKTILRKGMFQRMWITFANIPTKDKLEYIKNKAKIVNASYEDRIEIVKKIRNLLDELPQAQKVIVVNIEDYHIFNQTFVSYLEKCLKDVSFKDSKQDILESFITRNDMIINLAAQKAICDLRNEVLLEDLLYGLECYKEHIRSVIGLLMRGEKVSNDEDANRRKEIIKLIKQKPNFYGIYEVRDLMVDRDDWDLGKLTTYRLVKEMVDDGTFQARTGAHNKKLLFI